MMGAVPASRALAELPAYDLDPADVRRYVVEHSDRVFNIRDRWACLLASLLRERHGKQNVEVGETVVRVGEETFRWDTWATVLQRRLMATCPCWRGTDIVPILDAVLREHGIVVEAEAEPAAPPTEPPAPLVDMRAALDALLAAFVPPAAPDDDAGRAATTDTTDTVIIAPAARARHIIITPLDGMPREPQVEDRRPAVAHRVE